MKDFFCFLIFLFVITCCTLVPESPGDKNTNSDEIGLGNVSLRVYSDFVNENLFSRGTIEISGPDFNPLTSELFIDYSNKIIYGAISNVPSGRKRSCKIELFNIENKLVGWGITSNITILPGKTTPVTVWIFLTKDGVASITFNVKIEGYFPSNELIARSIFLNFTNEVISCNSNLQLVFTNSPLVENASLKFILFDGGYELFNGVVLSNISISEPSNYVFDVSVKIQGGNCEVECVLTNGSITTLYLVENFEAGLLWEAPSGFFITLDDNLKRSGEYSLLFRGAPSDNQDIFISPAFFNTNYGQYISFWINGRGENKSIVLRAGTNRCYWNVDGNDIASNKVIYPSGSPKYGSGFDTRGNWCNVKLYIATNIVPEEFTLVFRGGSNGNYEFWVDDFYIFSVGQ